MDLKIIYEGLNVCTVKDVKVIKELPEKGIFLARTNDGSQKWLKTGQDSIEFSSFNFDVRKSLYWKIKRVCVFEYAKEMLNKSKTEEDNRKKSKLIKAAEEHYIAYVNISKKLGVEFTTIEELKQLNELVRD